MRVESESESYRPHMNNIEEDDDYNSEDRIEIND